MAQEICVTWKEFQKKGISIFEELRESTDFADVTLVSEDGQQFRGHKVILGSSCPFFMDLLRKNEHPYPLVHMMGVKSVELSAVMDFLYKGESNILQEHLEAFLALAQKLRLNGLTRTEELSEELFTNTPNIRNHTIKEGETLPRPISETTKARQRQCEGVVAMPVQLNPKRFQGEVISDIEANKVKQHIEAIDIKPDIETVLVSKPDQPKPKCSSAYKIQSEHKATSNDGRDYSKDLEMKQLDEQIDSLLEERSPRSYACKLCGKTVKRRCDIRHHIEAIHITGFVHYCDVCGNANRTRKHLSEHRRHAGHPTFQQPIQNDNSNKVSVKPEEVDETLKSMMEYGKYMGVSASGQKIRARICKTCGKEGRMNSIMKHIERNHIDTGVPNYCNDCGKTFATRTALKYHHKRTFCFSLSKFDMKLA